MQQVIVLYNTDAVAESVQLVPVAGDHDAIMAYGEKLCQEAEAEQSDNPWQFVLTTMEGPAAQCFMPQDKSGVLSDG